MQMVMKNNIFSNYQTILKKFSNASVGNEAISVQNLFRRNIFIHKNENKFHHRILYRVIQEQLYLNQICLLIISLKQFISIKWRYKISVPYF